MDYAPGPGLRDGVLVPVDHPNPGRAMHSCSDCQEENISPGEHLYVVRSSPTSTRPWIYTLKHSVAKISAAASRGCPFFVWLNHQLVTSQTPPEQLQRTKIELEFETGNALGTYVEDSIRSVTVRVSTLKYAWSPGGFDVVSIFDNLSADHAIARSIVGNVSAPRSLQQIRERLAYCLQHHERCRLQNSSVIRPARFLDVDSTRSIGVVKLRTVELDSSQPYVTLSYVWGQDQATKTTLSTMARHESGIPIHSLPKTIRDAIAVTRYIGVKLLWVDSLCIVQDDPDELAREIADMSFYYGNSLLTLSISSASHCDEGFLKYNRHTEPQRINLSFPFVRVLGRSRGYIHLLPPEPPLREPLDHRAWTLQEGLLCTRLVSFGSNTISWSCYSAHFGTIPIGPLRATFQNALPLRSNLSPRIGIYATIREDPTTGSQALRSFLSDERAASRESFADFGLGQMLSFWDDIVHEYTFRALSDPRDKLSAISGVAMEFARRFSPPMNPEMPRYLAGIWWSSLFPLQLLWKTKGSCKRHPFYVAPSWSWASISGELDRELQRDLLPKLGESAGLWHIQIGACHIIRQNPRAPYGPIASGYIIVDGLTTTATRTLRPDAESLRQNYIEVSLDVDDDPTCIELPNKDYESVCLLEIRREERPSKVPKRLPRGLVLLDNMDGTYRRLGLFYSYVPDTPRETDIPWEAHIPWERMTLQIV